MYFKEHEVPHFHALYGEYNAIFKIDTMEISGARWGICGAEGILKLRSVAKSNDWDKYWEFYTTQAKNNDFFPTEAISLNLLQKLNA